MAQIKIYALRSHWTSRRKQLSDTIHACVCESLGLPENKRFHRFILLDKGDFIYPDGRSDNYLIIEITMMSGRTIAARKGLIRLLYNRLANDLQLALNDIEVCITETPPCNWGFRGQHGDEVKLNYAINV